MVKNIKTTPYFKPIMYKDLVNGVLWPSVTNFCQTEPLQSVAERSKIIMQLGVSPQSVMSHYHFHNVKSLIVLISKVYSWKKPTPYLT